jgi:hypothetical protein
MQDRGSRVSEWEESFLPTSSRISYFTQYHYLLLIHLRSHSRSYHMSSTCLDTAIPCLISDRRETSALLKPMSRDGNPSGPHRI